MSKLPFRRAPLAAAITLLIALPSATHAADGASRSARELDQITVTATPMRASAEDIAAPVEVLAGETLDRSKGATLGQTLSGITGVQGGDFGVGVSRPIIRGQEGPRVQILSGGLATLDVSAVSADHAVSVEPFLADQIEVLKGPATLLFGSGAIGGAVNVVDGRIASDLPDRAINGRAEVRGNSVNDERTGMFRLDGVSGHWVLHVDGLVRNADDVEIPGVARLESHEHEHDHGHGHDDHGHHHDEDEAQIPGILPNSAIKTRAAGFGATRLGERGYFGMAGSSYRTNYGIPDGAHVHGDHDHDHGHGDHDDHGHDEDDHGHEEGSVRIDLVQNRWDVRGGLYDPLDFLQRVDLRMAWNDYTHTEFEGDRIGTLFDNRGLDGRIEAVQNEIAGWRGAFGLQFGRSDFRAKGEEAFVPATRTGTLGAFALQEKDFDPVKIELGARYDTVKLDPVGARERSFGLANLCANAIWQVSDRIDLRLGLDRSERAPINEELYAAGLHMATRSIEIGDANLDTERANRAEFGLHAHTARMTFKAAIYQTRFTDFIYQADTGVVEHGTPVRLWTQQDAVFRGAEAEAVFHLIDAASGQLDLRLFGDTVRARLDGHGSRTAALAVPHGDHFHRYTVELSNEGNVPRIAPTRAGVGLSWTSGGLSASAGAVRYDAQNRVADNEEPSPGYTLVNAHLAYRWDLPDASWEVFLDGSNLGDSEARPHTSLLRDYAPLPGRAVAFGIRVYF